MECNANSSVALEIIECVIEKVFTTVTNPYVHMYHDEIIENKEVMDVHENALITNNHSFDYQINTQNVELEETVTPHYKDTKAIDVGEESINSKVINDQHVSMSTAATSSVNADVEMTNITVTSSEGVILNVKLCSNEEIRKKGYAFKSYEPNWVLTSLLIAKNSTELINNEIRCVGLRFDAKHNHIMSIFEHFGVIYQIRGKSKGTYFTVFVTYLKQDAAKNAIKHLNGSKIDGNIIHVSKNIAQNSICVSPIPTHLTKKDLLRIFQSNFYEKPVNVVVLNSKYWQGNRGYCYLEYENNFSAQRAKRNIEGSKLFHQSLCCEWPSQSRFSEFDDDADTVYVINLKEDIHASTLRIIFSKFGQIRDIDKWAQNAEIQFVNVSDAKRAVQEVDKTLLGNQNVEVSFYKLLPRTK